MRDDHYFRSKNIFHFGTGNHHVIGRTNYDKGYENCITGLTLQDEEHFAYISMIKKNPMYAKNYKVMYADIYTLNKNFLPKFDVFNLFHLGEYFYPNTPYYQFNSELDFLNHMVDLMSDDSRMIFYKRSAGFKKSEQTIKHHPGLTYHSDYKSLLIYKKAKE